MKQQDADYVVVGGGTAGCIIAARLSEDPNTRVVLLEAGPPDRDIWIHIPAGYARLSKSRRYDWGYATEPEPELGGRSIAWPRGKVLGGSGSVNGLVFLRGSPHDYDRWAQAGARGWSWEDVLPTFRRIEHWEGAAGDTRGKDGPIPVSEPRSLSIGAAAFLAGCQAAGFPLHRDINDGAIEGAAAIQMNVHAGRRISTAQAYLRPARNRPNLRVITGAAVQRVVITDGRATGVKAIVPGQPAAVFGASREVILCSGSIATPHLLMLSGVGDGAMLAGHGIATALHRPAVGQNLQDHLIARLSYRTRPAGTLNERTATRMRMAAMALGYAMTRSGPLAVGATEATLFARATPGAEEAELQYQFINFSLVPDAGYVLPRHPGVMMNWGPCRPDSRGSLTLRSPDPRIGSPGDPRQLPIGPVRPAPDGARRPHRPQDRPHRTVRRIGGGGTAATARRGERRRTTGLHPRHRHHRLPPVRYLSNGHRRGRRARSAIACPRLGRAARGRRVGDAVGAVLQHPARGDDAAERAADFIRAVH